MFNFVKNFVLGIFVAIYMLVYKERCAAHFRRFLISCLSPSQARYTFRFASLLDRSFGGFIEGQLLDALIVGIITYILFNIFNFTNPLLLATIIAVTNVIPVLGPFIGGIPAAFLVLLTQPEKVFLFVILILVVQQIDGNLICPHILGDKINISSLATLIAIIVMGGLFGIFGMLIGVPVFAVVLQLINNYTANALRRKGMETSIENYYVGNSNIVIEKNKTQGTKKLLLTIKSITNKLLTKKKNSNKKEK
jgi:predicted PurR-regulated permease PerM